MKQNLQVHFIYLSAVLISLIGMLLELKFGFDIAFQRSGYVMIMSSIALIFYNHFLEDNFDRASQENELYEKMRVDPNSIQKVKIDSSNSKVPVSEEQLKAILVRDLPDLKKTKIVETSKRKKEIKVKIHKLVQAEFGLGMLGTAICGFGDILIKALLC